MIERYEVTIKYNEKKGKVVIYADSMEDLFEFISGRFYGSVVKVEEYHRNNRNKNNEDNEDEE